MMEFCLTSPEIRENGSLSRVHEYDEFGGSGDNCSPALGWDHAPAGTQSFAITLYDPDAPTGSGFWHWVAFDIKSDVVFLPQDAGNPDNALLPAGAVQSANDYGIRGFGGACPPPGAQPHRYIFTVHALSVERLGINEATPNAVARFLIHANSLASASLTASYQR
jgi:Raf kinase inhibitor-like YbhB/YbcL family protein